MYFNKKLHQLLENLDVACYYQIGNFWFVMDIFIQLPQLPSMKFSRVTDIKKTSLYDLKKPFVQKLSDDI